jgi:hypothetical protein
MWDTIFQLAIHALVEHSAIFSPTEQTYALHELIHIVQQTPRIGPPKFNNLFMYERFNSTLKRMIKNKCNSMASIVKAYAVFFLYTLYNLYVFICIVYVFNMYLSKQCIIV